MEVPLGGVLRSDSEDLLTMVEPLKGIPDLAGEEDSLVGVLLVGELGFTTSSGSGKL